MRPLLISVLLLAVACKTTSQPAPARADAGCRTPCGFFDDGGFGKCPGALPGYNCVDGCCVAPDLAGACSTCSGDADCGFARCGQTGGICIGGACSFAPGCAAACSPRDPKACGGAGPAACFCGDLSPCCCITWLKGS